nr:MAG TPA: hypothetical protein [Caudoviricetes sp.]
MRNTGKKLYIRQKAIGLKTIFIMLYSNMEKKIFL